MEVIKFKNFPEAYPYFKEDQIPIQKARARAMSTNPKNRTQMREINRKAGLSQKYFDLMALKERKISTTKSNYDTLIRGFMTVNTDVYREKGEGARNGLFADKDSRWFGMTRPAARAIVLDEVFSSFYEEVAEVPKPEQEVVVAQSSNVPNWVLPVVGVSASFGIAYLIHSRSR